MATISVGRITSAGYTPSPVSADAGGDAVPNTHATIIRIVNGGGTSYTVAFAATGTLFGESIANVSVSVPAGEERLFRLVPSLFNNGSGQVAVSYTGSDPAADLTIEAWKV